MQRTFSETDNCINGSIAVGGSLRSAGRFLSDTDWESHRVDGD